MVQEDSEEKMCLFDVHITKFEIKKTRIDQFSSLL